MQYLIISSVLIFLALAVFAGEESYVGGSAHSGVNSVDLPGKKYTRPDDNRLRSALSQIQYDVTQKEATEPAYNNKYWDNKEAGIYVDIVSGEPLFSSLDKFRSGTGWPSFSQPLVSENIVEKKDRKFFMIRTEVRSANADSHLGHIFDDGPEPTGLRYCVNSASLDFVPVADLEERGYGEFIPLFR